MNSMLHVYSPVSCEALFWMKESINQSINQSIRGIELQPAKQEPRTAKEIYDLLLDRYTVKIGLATKQEYHALRMQLWRIHEASKEILEIEDSIVTSWKKGVGTFKFGQRKPTYGSFQLIVEDNENHGAKNELKQSPANKPERETS